jgi:hypothetical protein
MCYLTSVAARPDRAPENERAILDPAAEAEDPKFTHAVFNLDDGNALFLMISGILG